MFVISYNNLGKICHSTKFEDYQGVTIQDLNSMGNETTYMEIDEPVYALVKDSVQTDHYYVDAAGTLALRGEKPSNFHEWSWEDKQWTLSRASLELSNIAEANSIFYRECNAALDFNGVLFDADALARSRITAVLSRWTSIGTLPNGFIGWMDYNNNLQWVNETPTAIRDNLSNIARAIEDREQSLIKKHWQIKTAIRSLTNAELLNADIEAMWDSLQV